MSTSTTTAPVWVARALTISLWGVGSILLIKTELSAPSVDWFTVAAWPIVWAAVICLPILCGHALRSGQVIAASMLALAAIVGSALTLSSTLGRQAEARDERVAQAKLIEDRRAALSKRLAVNQSMLAQAVAKCGKGRRCLPATQATINVYQDAVRGTEAQLEALRPVAPVAGEHRVAAALAVIFGGSAGAYAEGVGLFLPALLGLTLELSALACAMFGFHPSRTRKTTTIKTAQQPIENQPTPPRPRRTYRKDDALADVLEFRRPMQQHDLSQRWNVTKAMVSMWLDEFEDKGLVRRHRNGKTNLIVPSLVRAAA